MRHFLLPCASLPGLAAPSAAAESTIGVGGRSSSAAQFSTRTSLKVSSQVLQFAVPSGDETARVEVDFTAAARTRAGGEVILLVESLATMTDRRAR